MPQREAKGQFLLDHCFKYLNLMETDFFGLRFTDQHNQKVRLFLLSLTRLIIVFLSFLMNNTLSSHIHRIAIT